MRVVNIIKYPFLLLIGYLRNDVVIDRRIKTTFLLIWMFILVFVSGYIISLYGIYIFPIEYSLMGIRISYIVGVGLGIGLYKFWIRFIKRKLHFILMGDSKL